MPNNPKLNFADRVSRIIGKIPRGKVLTYGQVATLAGVPRAARIVGGILYHQASEKKLPWQRVINREGKVSTYRIGMGREQVRLLKREGVQFSRREVIDLKIYQWCPSNQILKTFGLDDEVIWDFLEN